MQYESEFEIIETINSSITKKKHQYSHFYRVQISCNKEFELHIRDMRANFPVPGVTSKHESYYQNKLALGYQLYTETGIHPLHLYFFHDIPREMWNGYLYGRNHQHKKYKTVQWYDLLYPLPFYPNLEGFCHSKQYLISFSLEKIRGLRYQWRDEIQFSLEWTIASLERYQGKVAKHNPDVADVLVSHEEAANFLKQGSRLEVISS